MRDFYWLQEQSIALLATPPPGYAQRVWQDGEVATVQALLRAAGRPATAPPGWLPADPERRARVFSGAPPPAP